MEVSSVNLYSCTFGNKKTFKKFFKHCTYSGENFEQHDTKTLEHIIPLSEGGKSDITNYFVVKRSWNSKRSSKPLDEFIKENPQVKENIKRTISEHEDDVIDGINWAAEVKKSLTKALGYDIFS